MGRVSLGAVLWVATGCQFAGTSSGGGVDDAAPPDAREASDAEVALDAAAADAAPPPTLALEAETFTRNSDTGPGLWELATSHAGFSGAGYLVAAGGSTCEPGACGRAEWDITLAEAGDYRIGFRFDATSSSRDTLYWNVVGREGTGDPSFSGGSPPFLHDFDHTAPDWSIEASGQIITMEAGDYTVMIDRRVGGLEIDRIELTRID